MKAATVSSLTTIAPVSSSPGVWGSVTQLTIEPEFFLVPVLQQDAAVGRATKVADLFGHDVEALRAMRMRRIPMTR
jgi:hypothetical protein